MNLRFISALWFRLSVRLKLPPFPETFKNKLWKIILKKNCYEFYEISESRKTVGRLDRNDYTAAKEEAIQQVHEFYHIYSYEPVDDPEIRGSCKEFKTRKVVARDFLIEKSVGEVDLL